MNHLPPDPTPQQRHHRGDHTGCRPGQCLAARVDHGTETGQRPAEIRHAGAESAEGTQPASTPDTPPAPAPCAVCGGLLEHITEISGQPYWAHLGSISGPPHSGQPADGDTPSSAGASVAGDEPRCAECVAGDHDQCTGSPATGNACRPCCWPAGGERS